jgi:hypothetical protein
MQTFELALHRHSSLHQAVQAFRTKGVTAVEPIWRALVDAADDPAADSYAEALRLTMPGDWIPVVRAESGVAAVFLMEAAAQAYEPKRDFFIAARAAWKAFEERAAKAQNIENGYGCDKSASWESARQVAGARDASMVDDIAKMAGRMYKVLHGVRTIDTDDPQQVKDVTLGGDVERLVASEIAQLATPGLDDAAAIRILEKRALQYKMKGRTAANRGPLVIMVDESNSMGDDGVGDRNSWAKACMVALIRVAHEGNRMVKVVHFGTSTVVTVCAPGDAQAVLDASRHFLDSGTDIARALLVGAKEVGNLALEGHIGADMVLITDGEDRADAAQEKVLALVQAQGVRLWTVVIECALREESPLNKRASAVVRVGRTDRADLVEALRGAADNTVTPSEQQAAEARAKIAAMN